MGCRRARAYASDIRGVLPSVRIMLPIDMKNLSGREVISMLVLSFWSVQGSRFKVEGASKAYPNVDPDISMYCPKVLIGPLGPAPNRMILKPPKLSFSNPASNKHVCLWGLTKDEAHDQANGWSDKMRGQHWDF